MFSISNKTNGNDDRKYNGPNKELTRFPNPKRMLMKCHNENQFLQDDKRSDERGCEMVSRPLSEKRHDSESFARTTKNLELVDAVPLQFDTLQTPPQPLDCLPMTDRPLSSRHSDATMSSASLSTRGEPESRHSRNVLSGILPSPGLGVHSVSNVSSFFQVQPTQQRKCGDFRIKFQDQGQKFHRIQLWLDEVARNSKTELEPPTPPLEEDSESVARKRGKVWKKLLEKNS